MHLFPAVRDILQAIPTNAKIFAKLDAVQGYFQLALDEEVSHLTTFLLPQGRFRYTRAPMGLNASSNKWCAKSDALIEGCPWARKIVDDTIIWAEDRQQLKRRIRQVLENCRRLNITISKKKFEIREEIEFAGHKGGISPDQSKYDAISKFQTPKNIKELRSFLGLAQQLGAFIPDLAHLTAKIRPLLKKGTAFL